MPAASNDAFRRAAELAPQRFSMPYRMDPGNFRALAREAFGSLSRPGSGAVELLVAPLPGPEEIGPQLSPDARWARSGAQVTLFQVNHEIGSSSEGELTAVLAESLRAALAPRAG